jgi:phage portal protein BeeE
VSVDLFRDRPDGKGKDIAKDHALYPLFTVAPNETQTTFEFFETLIFHLEVGFNFYAFKSIVRAGSTS